MKKSRLIFIILIIFTIVPMIIGKVMGEVKIPEGDIEWVDPQEHTLSLAEHFSRENYIIEATDFYEDSVLITVYDKISYDKIYDYDVNNISYKIVWQQIAKMGDSWNMTDNENITRINFFIKDLKVIKGNISANEGLNVIVDQRVKIQTKLIGRPNPLLSIALKERKLNNRTFVNNVFTPDSEISVNFSVKNEGKATLRDVHLILNKSEIPFLFPDEHPDRQLTELKANDTNIINIRFRAPNVERLRKNYTISAYVTGTDAFGRRYNTTDFTYVVVKPFVEKIIEIKKMIPEKIYMGDLLYVTLSIKNNGFLDMAGVNLIEEIPAGLEPLDDMWNLSNFTLKKQETRLVLYKLRPKRPGIYKFPNSIVQWNDGKGNEGIAYSGVNKSMNQSIINGPYVELKKAGKIEGDYINISITARNFGDMTAIVRLRELIPKGVPIAKSLIVRPSSSVTFSYSINKVNLTDIISDDKITLPPAKAAILDQYLFSNDRYNQIAISNELVLNLSK